MTVTVFLDTILYVASIVAVCVVIIVTGSIAVVCIYKRKATKEGEASDTSLIMCIFNDTVVITTEVNPVYEPGN